MTRSRNSAFPTGSIWISVLAAAVVVLIDHRRTLRDLDIPARVAWRRWMTFMRLADRRSR